MTIFIKYHSSPKRATAKAITILECVTIRCKDSVRSFKTTEETETFHLNQYYAKYGPEYYVENLVWSSDMILNMCEYNLRDKVR